MKPRRLFLHSFLLVALILLSQGQDCAQGKTPKAAFTTDTQTGLAPLTVTFTDQSNIGSSTSATYAWDFGDGTSSTDRNPTHTYTARGNYSVTLTVTTETGTDTTDPVIISVTVPSTLESLYPITYFHVKDSDGTAPVDGVDVALLFEPNGVADLYIGSQTEMLMYTGTYSYQNGPMSLTFTGEDFHPDVTFALDTNSAQVTMPFKVFSTDSGTSLWERDELDLAQSINLVFRCAVLAGKQPVDDAINRAVGYGNAVIAYSESLPKALQKSGEDDPLPPKTVGAMHNGVIIQYEGSPPLEVPLAGYTFSGGRDLETSALAADPRLNIEMASPHNGAMDPSTKEALFIAPFHSTKAMYAYDWLMPDAYTQGKLLTITQSYDFDNLEDFLEEHGYSTRRLMDEDASLMNIIDHLIQSSGYRTPGILIYSSHGSSSGSMCTGQMLGDKKDFRKAFNELCRQIQQSKYASLLTYDGGTLYEPKTFNFLLIGLDGRARTSPPRFLCIRTKFWDWLHTMGADFSRSLVYLGMCNVDQDPDLGAAIKARALFCFRDTTQPDMAGRTCQYLIKFLSKHTRSAEEAYYNIIRISKTFQMIYPEDALFNNVIDPKSYTQLYRTPEVFKAYGCNPYALYAYDQLGWLANGDGANAGNIWWLLFAGRWSNTAQAGVDSLLDCWNRCWSVDPSPCSAIGEPFCTNAAPGKTATQNEVAYATFLLNGSENLEYTGGTFVPRWTMNDGGD